MFILLVLVAGAALAGTDSDLLVAPALAGPRHGPESTSAAESGTGEPGFFDREKLSADWGGTRSTLSKAGVDLNATYIGETQANVAGGIRRGAVYDALFEADVDLDLEKLADWSGAAIHASMYQINGRGLSTNFVGSDLTASNIEAIPSTRLFTLWIQQNWFDDRLSLRVGQIASDDEFILSPTSANFMNATFGWLALATLDLPSSGPVFPLATPGARIEANLSENLRFLSAVFGGDPGGNPGAEDAQIRNCCGTAFRFEGGDLLIDEIQYFLNSGDAGLPGIYKIGGWYHSGEFDHARNATLGLSLADPAGRGVPFRHRGDYALYAVADQMVWRTGPPDDRSLNLFMRIGGAPADRNLIEAYVEGGAALKGAIPGRGGDTLGLAAGYAKISHGAEALDRDAPAFSSAALRGHDCESILEVTYIAAIAPWWTVQPDAQYFFHPGGHVANPADPTGQSAIADAVVIGLRTTLRF